MRIWLAGDLEIVSAGSWPEVDVVGAELLAMKASKWDGDKAGTARVVIFALCRVNLQMVPGVGMKVHVESLMLQLQRNMEEWC